MYFSNLSISTTFVFSVTVNEIKELNVNVQQKPNFLTLYHRTIRHKFSRKQKIINSHPDLKEKPEEKHISKWQLHIAVIK